MLSGLTHLEIQHILDRFLRYIKSMRLQKYLATSAEYMTGLEIFSVILETS